MSDFPDEILVEDRPITPVEPRILHEVGYVLFPSSGEIIDHPDLIAPAQQSFNEVRPDESGATSHKDFHRRPTSMYLRTNPQASKPEKGPKRCPEPANVLPPLTIAPKYVKVIILSRIFIVL
jgi:hypothetical protein